MRLSHAVLLLPLLACCASAAVPPWYDCDCSARNNCMCPSLKAPGGLDPKEVPQFVLWTHDDGITQLTERSFRGVADSRRNPNGCPVRATMFTTEQDTDCDLAHGLWKDGYEIATHTKDHAKLADGTPKNVTVAQILGARSFLAEQCGIPEAEIRGFRNPYLVTNPVVRQVLFENGFQYDSTLLEAPNSESLSTSMEQRTWPYTLDFGVAQNCGWYSDTQACNSQERWPGLWEVPLWVLQVLGLEFTMDPGFYGGKGVYEPLRAAFDAAYGGNRAPLPVYIHTTWVEKDPGRLDELKRFADYTLEKGDVYWVTMAQLIAWMKDPVPASELRRSQALCARIEPPPPLPKMPEDGANLTLALRGATPTQVADQQDRLVAAAAALLGSEPAATFVAAVAGGPGADAAAPAELRAADVGPAGDATGDLLITLVAAGAEPMSLYQQSAAQDRRDELAGELAAMGLELAGPPAVVPFQAGSSGGVALPLGGPTQADAPVPAPAPAPAPMAAVVKPTAPAPAPSAAPALSPAPAASSPDAASGDGASPAQAAPTTASTSAPAAPVEVNAENSSSEGGLATGVVVGIAVGAAVAVALLGVAVAALLGWRPRRRPSKQLAADVIHQLPHSSRSSFSSSSRGSPTKQAAEGKDAPRKLDIVVMAQ